MQQARDDKIRQKVRETYGKIAAGDAAGCGCGCNPSALIRLRARLKKRWRLPRLLSLGYSQADLRDVPEGAETTLGSGNPLASAALQPGETVLDLGSGAGLDCFIAAKQVGEDGRVIGVDMTPEMVSRARDNAEKGGYANVEFRLGEIERLPVADASVDVIVSNCVINLSPDKPTVYRDAFRALRPGGRLAISDVVATAELPAEVRDDLTLYAACVSGAATVGELHRILSETGFEKVNIQPKDESRDVIREWAPGRKLEDYIVSAAIEAVKPRN